MIKYIFRRIVWMPVLLLMVSLIVFGLGTYGPGDPVEVQLGNNYDEKVGITAHNTIHHSAKYPSQIQIPIAVK